MTLPNDSGQEDRPLASGHLSRLWDLFRIALEAGHQPRIEDYLPLAPESDRPTLLLQLVQLEFAYLRRQGANPTPDQYARRFPALAWGMPVDQIETVVFSSPRIFIPPNDTPRTNAPPRCPYCHNSLVDITAAAGQVVCPACGSSFRLLDSYQPSTVDSLRRLDEFQLQLRLGRGAFGEVWKAWDTTLKRHVAIKIPFRSMLAHPDQVERIEREAQNAARLRHQGIVTLHGVRTIDGVPMLITDFIEGLTLRDFLESHPLKFSEIAQIVAQLADALDYAHRMGLVHRDIKPGNIMMERCEPRIGDDRSAAPADREHVPASQPAAQRPGSPAFRPVIVDFGLALQTEAEVVLTIEGQLVGTVAYMSPEQARGSGHEADARSDVYSLGIVLYEMLTGVLPFRGSKTMILDQVLREEPRRLRKLNDKIPRDLETICLKAIHKDPARRYQTARALAEDLRNYLEDRPIRARPVGRVERTMRWCKRNPRLAVASGLAAGGLLAFTIMLAIAYHLQRDAAEKSRRTAASYALDRALAHLERNEGSQGMLWLSRSLELAPSDAADLQRVIRSNLVGWLDRMHPLTAILPHPSPSVSGAVLTRDGRTAVTISGDRCFIWDTIQGELRWPALQHADAIRSLALDASEQLLVTGSYDGTACIWDIATGKRHGPPLKHPKPVSHARFDRRGARVITICADRVVRLWQVADGTPIGPALQHDHDIKEAVLSGDGQLVYTSTDDKKAYLWLTASGSCVRKWACASGYSACAFDPDSQSVALITGKNALQVHSKDGALSWERQCDQQGPIHTVRFSSDGQRVLTLGRDGSAQLWRAQDGQPLTPLCRHTSDIGSYGFDPRGRFVVTGGDDATARLWDTTTGLPLGLPLHHGGTVKSISISGDGGRILTASLDATARLWRPSSVALPKGLAHDDKIWSAVFHPTDQTLITASGSPFGSGSAQLWNLRTGKRLSVIVPNETVIDSLSISSDGAYLASASTTQAAVRISAIPGGREVARLGHEQPVSAVAFLPGGRRLLTGGHDNKVHVWEVPSGKPIGGSWDHPDVVTSIAVDRKGDLAVTGCTDRRARLWQVSNGQFIREFLHLGLVHAVAFCLDGKKIATASSDRTAALWDAMDGKLLSSLHHPDIVRALAISPDGMVLATGCYDGYVRLWDVSTGKLLGPPLPLAPRFERDRWMTSRVWTVAFSPDGTQLFCAGDDKTGLLWPAVPKPLEGNVADIVRHIKVITGMELDDAGAARDLPDDAWRQLKAADERH